ncbi:MAG: hypothetical protein R6U52_07170 [Kosmotogaceae bacterium]
MKMNYPLITKLIITAILGILSVVVPFAILKVIFVLVAIVLFATLLKKFAWLLITLAVLFIVLPIVALSAFGVFQSSLWNLPNHLGVNWENLFDNTFTSRGSYNASNARTLYPDTYVEAKEYIYFDGLAFEVEFDPESEKIHVPDEITVKELHGILRFELPDSFLNTKAVITIGTKQPYKEVEFDAVFVEMNGDVETNKFIVDSTSVKFNGNIVANSLIKIRSTSCNARGSLSSEQVQIDGTSININGNISAENIRLSGTSINFDVDIERTEEISLIGTSVTGSIKYLDSWTGSRKLSAKASRGDLDIWIPKSSGTLSISKSGIVSITERRY